MIWSEEMMWEGFQCRETSTRECSVMMAEGKQMAIESSALDCRKPSVIWWAFEKYILCVSSVQFSSVAQSCLTLCDPMNCSMQLPVHQQLLEFTQTYVHRVGDAIQPSHPLLSSSPPAPNPSQHQSLSQWVTSSRTVQNDNPFCLSGLLLWLSWWRVHSNEGDLGSIPGLGRFLEKEKATHSSILSWRIPWTV